MSDLPIPGRTILGIYQLQPSTPAAPFPSQVDVLSSPSTDDLAPVLYDLLPQGAAWRSPDGSAFEASSRLGAFLRSLAGDMATLYRRIFQVSQESTAVSLVDSLGDWEIDYGLPDPCFGEDQSVAQRTRALLLKIRSKGTISPDDFVGLAAGVGYEITIREPRPFAFGFSQTGWDDSTGDAAAYFWFVQVSGRAARQFEFGVSRTGIDSLLDIARLTDLECLFRALAPAWTRVVFDYS